MSKKFPKNVAGTLFFLFDSYSLAATQQHYAKHCGIPKDFHLIGNNDDAKYYFCYAKRIILKHYGQNEKPILLQLNYIDTNKLLNCLSKGMHLQYKGFEFPMLVKLIYELCKPIKNDQQKYEIMSFIKNIEHLIK
ncbi:MAG: hypothetical protein Q7T91_00500 [Sulfuricurvum sp.]|nr:hypothetical protein [Sulfuricurvum sp.]